MRLGGIRQDVDMNEAARTTAHRGLKRLFSRREVPEDNDASVLSPSAWFTDDANHAVAPLHGRADFLTRAWEIIDEAHVEPSSTVFALVGPWGSGKSSMLDWLRNRAKVPMETTPWTVVDFNPWDYPDSSTLQMGFFATLQSSFSDAKLDATRRFISDLGLAVAPFTAAAAAWGFYDPSKIVESGAKLLGAGRSAEAARRKLVKALVSTKRPVLIIIDDLDRISADELLLTLKLIRQLGRLPYVHYLLSYDESTILDVLTRTNLIGSGEVRRARDYMEKVVQVRFDVPSLRPEDVVDLTNKALRELSDATGHVIEVTDDHRFQLAYTSFLATRLSTPRGLRRYFAQARVLNSRTAGEIDLVDFLVLTWIRTFEPGVYGLIQHRRMELIGSPLGPDSSLSPKQLSESKLANRAEWRKALHDVGTREADDSATLLAIAALFPRFASAVEVSTRGSTDAPHLASEDYFDRYFSIGIPDGDLADSVARMAIADLEAGNGHSPAVLKCRTRLAAHPVRAVTKIVTAAEAASIAHPDTFAWLAGIYEANIGRLEPVRATFAIERLVTARLRELPNAQLASVLEAMTGGRKGMLMGMAVRWATQPEDHDEDTLELTPQTRAVLSRGLEDLIAADGGSVKEMKWRVWEAVVDWSSLDPAGFSTWLRDQTLTHGEIAALGYFVRLTVSFGATGENTRIERFDLDRAAPFVDLEDLQRRYALDVAAAPESIEKIPDTPENRRLAAFSALRAYRPE